MITRRYIRNKFYYELLGGILKTPRQPQILSSINVEQIKEAEELTDFKQFANIIVSTIDLKVNASHNFIFGIINVPKSSNPNENRAFVIIGLSGFKQSFHIKFDSANPLAKMTSTNDLDLFETIWKTMVDKGELNTTIINPTGTIMIHVHNENVFGTIHTKNHPPMQGTNRYSSFGKLCEYFGLGKGMQGYVIRGFMGNNLQKEIALKCLNVNRQTFISTKEIAHLNLIKSQCNGRYLCIFDSFVSCYDTINYGELSDPKDGAECRNNGVYYVATNICKNCTTFANYLSDCKNESKNVFDSFRVILNNLIMLHDMEVTHMDIKPENILMEITKIPLIIDFGMSCNINDDNVHTCVRDYSTPPYSSPIKVLYDKIYEMKYSDKFYSFMSEKIGPADKLFMEKLFVLSKLNDLWSFIMMLAIFFHSNPFELFPISYPKCNDCGHPEEMFQIKFNNKMTYYIMKRDDTNVFFNKIVTLLKNDMESQAYSGYLNATKIEQLSSGLQKFFDICSQLIKSVSRYFECDDSNTDMTLRKCTIVKGIATNDIDVAISEINERFTRGYADAKIIIRDMLDGI